MIVDQAEFDAERWYRILQDQKVSVWYTAPTAIRMLMKVGSDIARQFDLSHLQYMASVGEPLNPEAVIWSAQTFGKPFHDNWWQTETGGIMIANYQAMDVRPGSMGKPYPVWWRELSKGRMGISAKSRPSTVGELALGPAGPQ